MTKLEKLRDQEAKEYAESCDNQSGSFLQNQLEAIRKKAFKAGWDAAMTIAQDELAKLKECEAKLFRAYQKLIKTIPIGFKDPDYLVEARLFLDDHKRMMEGVE